MDTVESSLAGDAGSRQEGSSPHKPCTPVFARAHVSLLFCPDSFCQPAESGSCLPNASVELGLKEEVVGDR